MQRHRSPSLSPMGGYDDAGMGYGARRMSRSSALLLGLALIGAAVTVAFGIWMAGVVPSTSIGHTQAAPISTT